jgi:LysR family nod box-dependent transcriptional activator
MRFKKLDLNLLVALDVLLSEQNITRAARRLHLSQSAASGVLGRLREYFNDELLTQVGRGMVPTALALELVEPVQRILRDIQTTIEMRVRFDPAQVERCFRVIASDYSTAVAITGVVQKLSSIAPGVSLEIITPNNRSLEQAGRGEIDLVLMARGFKSLSEAKSELLFKDQYCCAVWSKNDRVGDTLNIEEFLELGHVATNFGDRDFTLEEVHFNRLNITRRIEITCSMFSSLPQLVIGTNRVATIHKRLAEQAATHLPIRLLPTPVAIPDIEIMMMWHPYLDQDPAHQWLRNLFHEVIAEQSMRDSH